MLFYSEPRIKSAGFFKNMESESQKNDNPSFEMELCGVSVVITEIPNDEEEIKD